MAKFEPEGAPASPFSRRSPPMPMQLAYGAYIYGFVAPFGWVMEKFGRAERGVISVLKRREKRLRRLNPLRDYVPGPQDVFVATYAKSGTNWMMQIVQQLIHHGKSEFEHIHDVVPWPDTEVMSPLLRRYAIPLRDAVAWRDAPERRRVIKTHFNADMLPMSSEARYIMVIRDPKDVFVSNYHFIRDAILGPAMPCLDTWYRIFVAGKSMGGSWASNSSSYWAERRRRNVLIVSFKSMKRDLAGTVRRVAEFLGIRVSDEVLATVGERASFAYMKQIDRKFQPGQLIPWREPGAMLRKGAQGGSSELLSLERQREIDSRFTAELKKLKSDLPYEEFADLA